MPDLGARGWMPSRSLPPSVLICSRNSAKPGSYSEISYVEPAKHTKARPARPVCPGPNWRGASAVRPLRRPSQPPSVSHPEGYQQRNRASQGSMCAELSSAASQLPRPE